jgi:hypothetical protein
MYLPWATPLLQSISFNNEGTRVVIKFDRPTTTPISSTSSLTSTSLRVWPLLVSDCALIIKMGASTNGALGISPNTPIICQWTDLSSFEIILSPLATIGGYNLTIQSGIVAAYDNSSYVFPGIGPFVNSNQPLA